MTQFIPKDPADKHLDFAAKYFSDQYSFEMDREDEAGLVISRESGRYLIEPYNCEITGVYRQPRTEESRNLMPEDVSSITLESIVSLEVRSQSTDSE